MHAHRAACVPAVAPLTPVRSSPVNNQTNATQCQCSGMLSRNATAPPPCHPSHKTLKAHRRRYVTYQCSRPHCLDPHVHERNDATCDSGKIRCTTTPGCKDIILCGSGSTTSLRCCRLLCQNPGYVRSNQLPDKGNRRRGRHQHHCQNHAPHTHLPAPVAARA
jgi:hypothetical protein